MLWGVKSAALFWLNSCTKRRSKLIPHTLGSNGRSLVYYCFIAKSLRYALSFFPHVASISFRANCLKPASSSCHKVVLTTYNKFNRNLRHQEHLSRHTVVRGQVLFKCLNYYVALTNILCKLPVIKDHDTRRPDAYFWYKLPCEISSIILLVGI